VDELCKLLAVSRSGYYKWLCRQAKPDKDEVVADLIRQCHTKTHRTYGYRRVRIWLLRETGLVINHKAVLRIMRKYSLLATQKKKRFRHYDMDTYHHYENLLNQDFSAARPNEKWVTDISYIPTSQGFLYLSVIKDLFDKSIVAYRYARQMPAKLVIDTIHEAVKRAKPSQKLILHSDNGFQYASIPYFNVTNANGITPSMSGVGNPYDNACVESFFSLLKNECIYKARPKTIEDAMELIDEYIYFYNYERIQLASRMTPHEVRLSAA
jgi:transposase InsO family protein